MSLMCSLFANFLRYSSLNVCIIKVHRISKRSIITCVKQLQLVFADFSQLQNNRYADKRRALGILYNKRNMATLKTLQFDNLVLRTLPLDSVKENFVRQVRNSCFSIVDPTPVSNPELVVHSQSALDLLDLGQEEVEKPEFTEYFSGNKKLPGSETASHCYCGHQFGSFAGQLGDGAAIYLGEVINRHGERWEIQLKGAGKTPYSRSADGRKVLRSSIREFLCSEAMYYLGIPTTRAGSCITSDTKVVRDIFYNGNPKYEKSSIVLRISQTFIRFGSFEIFKKPDVLTGQRGPSAGQKELLIKLLDYVIKTFYPDVHSDNAEERYLSFFKEVVLRTARMVSEWQCVGFCHGVLNTDNMSILGLTIDYGPFGFMDHFNNGYRSNASDDMARYTYKDQPEICKWNLLKLAEALSEVLPISKSKQLLEEMYDKEFMKCYITKMRKKLGIIHKEDPKDRDLIEKLLQTMDETGADFTNIFRCLSKIKITDVAEFEKCNEEILAYIVSQCIDPSDIPNPSPASSQMQLLILMMNSNPALAAQLGGNSLIQAERERIGKAEKFQGTSPDEKREKDKVAWLQWMGMYRKRIQEDLEEFSGDIQLINETRTSIMDNNNPRFVLRNYIAESAIKAAEKGDYSLVEQVFKVLQTPYSSDPGKDIASKGKPSNMSNNVDLNTQDYSHFRFDSKPPKWGLELRVT